MTEDLLQPSAPEDPKDVAVPAGAAASPTVRPDDVPEKFWDPDAGAVRVESLLRSYGDLERKLSGSVRLPGADADADEVARFRTTIGVPEDPEGYTIEPAAELVASDPEINRRLHEAGFTQAQAQLVYDLAAEHLMPMIEQAAAEFEAERQAERLKAHFGEERWPETSRQLLAWGRANLPEAVLTGLATTYEGVLALHRMMEGAEPVLRGMESGTAAESDVRQMMRDPRYWRDREPSLVRKVGEAFRRLYPDSA